MGSVTEAIAITGLDVDDRRRLVLMFNHEPSADWKAYFTEHRKNRSQPGGSARYAVYISWETNSVHFAGMTVADFDERHKAATVEAVKSANDRAERDAARKMDEATRAQETKARLDQELEEEKSRARNVRFD